MKRLDELDQKELTAKAQSLIRQIKKTSPANDKANTSLALSILALASAENDSSRAQQLLKALKDLNL